MNALEPALEGTRMVRFAERSVARFGKRTPRADRRVGRGIDPPTRGRTECRLAVLAQLQDLAWVDVGATGDFGVCVGEEAGLPFGRGSGVARG
jgi:hypothetical protein